MANAQKWLAEKYPNKEEVREINWEYGKEEEIAGELTITDFPQIREIFVHENQLTQLHLKNCPQLIHLNCNYNKLTELTITNCPNLWVINAFKNQLTTLDLSNNRQLKILSISNNNFSSDLSFLSHLVNLQKIWLYDNNFTGCLEPLRNLQKLEWLYVNNTKISQGLKYLPASVKYFSCQKTELAKELEPFGGWESGWENWRGWKKNDFTYQQVREWINTGFLPSDYNYPQQWRNKNFTDEETREWVKAGTGPNDYKFVAWLRNVKQESPQWVSNYQEDYQILSERFKKYGLCQECNNPNTGDKWCQSCNASRCQENFSNWTSGKDKIDQFIQKYQLEATDTNKFLEWIPYEQFTGIEFLAQGGFGKVYKAKWIDGNIHHWDTEKKQWHKEEKAVVLKSLNNSQNNTDFLDETAKHKDIDDWFDNIVPCYGLSQDPETGNYLMVMKYMPEGNMRDYLSNKNKELALEDKISQLLHIAQGLKDIHQKKLVHRDFHSGNILKGIEKISCLITDLGLCKPVNEINKEDKIFGVMPYVAPEILQSQPYTQAADIYSFGMVAYEILSGLPPYYNQEHNVSLGIKICRGERPQFQVKIPQLLEDLINRCWDADPQKRLTANELEKTLRDWEQGDEEFAEQLWAAEEHNKILPDNIKFPKYKIHHGASYRSKLLPTKEITQLLQNSQLILRQNNSSELTSKQLIKIDKLAEEVKQEFSNSKKTSELTNYFLERSKELTKELETIIATNPSISEEGKETLEKIKKLKNELKVWNKEKEIEILFLESRIQELNNLIRKQKEKIVDAYLLHFDLEKELLQELIKTQLQIKKAQKQKLRSSIIKEYRKQFNQLHDTLTGKLEEEQMDKIETILDDCEELINWEMELEDKLNSKQLLLEEQRQFLQITISDGTERPILEQLIGKGGYGEVYQGKWKSQTVAVKKLYLSPNSTSNENIKEVTNEINILRKLKSKYIIQYYGIYSDEQELLIIMDYAKNGTLSQFINNIEEHDWSLNADLISQMTQGLAYIHYEGIIHRDLKSLNILLDGDYKTVKIADFGLSKTKKISSSHKKNNAVGSLRWMAPEALRDKEYSKQSDIYSLGMVIWEIVAKCTMPFKDFDDNLVQLQIISNKKEEIPKDIPKDIRDIIEQCWKDNPDERIELTSLIKIIENQDSQVILCNSLIGVENDSESSENINKQLQDLQLTGSNQSYIFRYAEELNLNDFSTWEGENLSNESVLKRKLSEELNEELAIKENRQREAEKWNSERYLVISCEDSQESRTSEEEIKQMEIDNELVDNSWFGPSHWLTDKEIDWALEKALNQLTFPYEQIFKFKVLELTQFMFVKEASKKDLEASISFPVLLSELTGFNGDLVLIPINNPDFHWSLLVYEKSKQTFYHWDTLNGSPNHGYIKPLIGDLLQQLHQNNNPDLNIYLILRDEIKQPNTWDCGIAVIEIAKRIMERFNSSLENINLGEFDFPQARINWRNEYENEQTKQKSIGYQAQIQISPKKN